MTPEARKEYNRRYYIKNRKECIERSRIAHKANRKEKLKYMRAYHQANLEKAVRWRLKEKYGITLEEKQEMLLTQGNVCAICGVDKPGGRWGWTTDHCHKSNKIRGVLCHHCNTGLGAFKDDLDLLHAAINYLENAR